jgi:hypothetical protein
MFVMRIRCVIVTVLNRFMRMGMIMPALKPVDMMMCMVPIQMVMGMLVGVCFVSVQVCMLFREYQERTKRHQKKGHPKLQGKRLLI